MPSTFELLMSPLMFALALYVAMYSLWPRTMWPRKGLSDGLLRAGGLVFGAGAMLVSLGMVVELHGGLERAAEWATSLGGVLILAGAVRMRWREKVARDDADVKTPVQSPTWTGPPRGGPS